LLPVGWNRRVQAGRKDRTFPKIQGVLSVICCRYMPSDSVVILGFIPWPPKRLQKMGKLQLVIKLCRYVQSGIIAA